MNKTLHTLFCTTLFLGHGFGLFGDKETAGNTRRASLPRPECIGKRVEE